MQRKSDKGSLVLLDYSLYLNEIFFFGKHLYNVLHVAFKKEVQNIGVNTFKMAFQVCMPLLFEVLLVKVTLKRPDKMMDGQSD